MANWALPTLTDYYTNFRLFISNRLDDVAKMFDSATTSPSNLPIGSKRWNSSANKFEKWSGSAWSDLATTYGISISGNAATATIAGTANYVTSISYSNIIDGLGYTPLGTTGGAVYGALNIMGFLDVADTISAGGTVSCQGAMHAATGIGTDGSLSVGGSATVAGTLTCSATLTALNTAIRASGYGGVVTDGVYYFGSGNSYIFKQGNVLKFNIESIGQALMTKGGTIAMLSDIPVEGVSKDQGYSAVGSLCLAEYSGGATLSAGVTVSGALLKPSDCSGSANGGVLSGTWRVLGMVSGGSNVSLFQRIV